MSYQLKGKVALVTGGGSGIGEACCRRFAEEAAAVYVTDLVIEDAERVANDISSAGGIAIARQLDVTNPQQWDDLACYFNKNGISLDILVNNAGIVIPSDAENCSYEDWKTTIRVNQDGVFLGTRMAIKEMSIDGGSIVNISSIEGIVGSPGLAAYNASKGGVRIFSKAVALECCQKGYPIRVNSVHPGLIKTALIEKALAQMSTKDGEALLSSLSDKTPMGRIGEPREIANACLFLASDESSFMTGSELVIDGGYTAQ
jgi:NAD(P)-dependent dehydrogenase (short-subunit alcohol dehydrogenase family)